jgi:hypothetical protein
VKIGLVEERFFELWKDLHKILALKSVSIIESLQHKDRVKLIPTATERTFAQGKNGITRVQRKMLMK